MGHEKVHGRLILTLGLKVMVKKIWQWAGGGKGGRKEARGTLLRLCLFASQCSGSRQKDLKSQAAEDTVAVSRLKKEVE
jgi:hypothetical protein